MGKMRQTVTYIAIFLSAVILLTGVLVLSAEIPQSAIRENLLESAEFLCDGPLFGTVIEGVDSSRIDRYADAILLSIAWQYYSAQPLESVIWSAYYYSPFQNENQNLLDAVTYGYPANQQYLRYWHGSIAIVRPLLTVFSLDQIYLLNGIGMAALTLWLLLLLCRQGMFLPALGMVLGLVMTSSWFVPLSLEYTWTYLLMLAGSVVAVKQARAGKWRYFGVFFLMTGILTNYLDFLTTEILPLLVPLMLVLWIGCRENDFRPAAFAAKAILAWGCGYVGMWLTKWLLAAAVLRENVIPLVVGHVQERIGGDLGLPLWQYMTGAVLRNVKCLFPLEYGTAGILVAISLLLFGSYIGYVYQKKLVSWRKIALFAALGLVPYVRYLALHNHAWLHCFFTYRAQLATILAAVLILGELTDWRMLGHGNAGKRKP